MNKSTTYYVEVTGTHSHCKLLSKMHTQLRCGLTQELCTGLVWV